MAEALEKKYKGKLIVKKKKPTIAELYPERLEKKRGRIELLANSIRSLRINVNKDLRTYIEGVDGYKEKEGLTALIIAIMLKTGERVGNEDSCTKGHYGTTYFKKSHVTVIGNKIHLDYVGKSGTHHEKSFSDELIAKALKKSIKQSPGKYVFETSGGQKIIPERVNRYLDEYGITSKDIRGHFANYNIINRLEKREIASEENPRQKEFNSAARCAAIKVGHGYATLKSHYMIPELETQYVQHGKIINLTDFYSGGN